MIFFFDVIVSIRKVWDKKKFFLDEILTKIILVTFGANKFLGLRKMSLFKIVYTTWKVKWKISQTTCTSPLAPLLNKWPLMLCIISGISLICRLLSARKVEELINLNIYWYKAGQGFEHRKKFIFSTPEFEQVCNLIITISMKFYLADRKKIKNFFHLFEPLNGIYMPLHQSWEKLVYQLFCWQ